MSTEARREPGGRGNIRLSADVKPFVPKFAGLSAAWSESSAACVFPSCSATYYPFVQEPPATEQQVYTEDTAFGASTFPAQYLSPEITLQEYTHSPFPAECTQHTCSTPTPQCDYHQRRRDRGFQTAKPQKEPVYPLPRETRAALKKKTYDEKKASHEQKCKSKRADGAVSSEVKSAQGSCRQPPHAEHSGRPDGYHKRIDRKPRIIEKGTSIDKPEFELSRLDFPELQGSQNSDMPEKQKQPRWGPFHSASASASIASVSEGEMVVKSNNPNEYITDNAASSSSSCTGELSWTPMGYIVRQTLSSEPSPAPKNVTSMINLKTISSSADLKNVNMSSSEILSSDPSYHREKYVYPTKKSKGSQGGDLEQNEVSRENKRKKEKSRSKFEILTVQEPPRIEDAEEFPNLAVASERRDRVESLKFQPKPQPQNNFKNSGKKSQIPVQLDLGGMLAALEKKQHAQPARQASRPVVFSVGAVPVLSKEAGTGERGRRVGQVKTPHNPLDSSAPLIKKGKQREVPKARKPTSLKKIILKERQERKQQRLQENATNPAVASDSVQDVESGASGQAPDQAHPAGPGSVEELASSPAAENRPEEQPQDAGTEPQRAMEACLPVPSLPKIHSRRFRDYCSQMLSKEVDACVTDLLKELMRFQDRMYQKDPVKAKAKRRLVLGLREVLKHLKLRKLKCVVISPNCERIQAKGGLDDTLHAIIDSACEQNIPFVFALNRKALGRSLNKAVPVSVVGIFSYDGAQDQFHKMVELTTAARQAYKTMLENTMLENTQQELAREPRPQTPPSPPAAGEEPHYLEIWRKHLETYSGCALEVEDSLEASTSQLMSLSL